MIPLVDLIAWGGLLTESPQSINSAQIALLGAGRSCPTPSLKENGMSRVIALAVVVTLSSVIGSTTAEAGLFARLCGKKNACCEPAPVCCPAPEPVCCPAPEPVCCPAPEPVPRPAPEPVAYCPPPAPVYCPAPEPVYCPAPEPVYCPAPEPVCCPAPEPCCEPKKGCGLFKKLFSGMHRKGNGCADPCCG